MDGYVSKPVKLEVLQATLAKFFSSQQEQLRDGTDVPRTIPDGSMPRFSNPGV